MPRRHRSYCKTCRRPCSDADPCGCCFAVPCTTDDADAAIAQARKDALSEVLREINTFATNETLGPSGRHLVRVLHGRIVALAERR